MLGEAVVFFAKSHFVASAALAAVAFGFTTSGNSTPKDIILAQQQSDPANVGQPSVDKPSATDDTVPSAPESGGSDDTMSRPADGGADGTATSDTAASPGSNAAPAPNADNPSVPSDPEDAPAKADGRSGAPTTNTAAPANGSADVAPVSPEPPAATAEPTAPASSSQGPAIEAAQLQIGAAVFGSDGAKIGEVNGVKSDSSGKVEEILVTAGGAAGINAKVFAVSADKITDVKDGVKLSLSSEEAKKLPIIDNSNG
jgi:hypothetical protein